MASSLTYERIFSGCGDKRLRVVSTEYPYNCVASIQFIFFKNGSSRPHTSSSTGFLTRVGGFYMIVTTAHSATHNGGIPLSRVQISLGREDEFHPYGMITKEVDDVWIHPKYGKQDKPNKYDMACIHLDKKILNDLKTKGFDTRNYFHLDTLDLDLPMVMSGYPGSVENPIAKNSWRKKTQWRVDVTECKRKALGLFLHYKNATSKGNSGSPIFTEKGGKCYVMAMHICHDEESNIGLVFTRHKIETLEEVWESDMDADSDD